MTRNLRYYRKLLFSFLRLAAPMAFIHATAALMQAVDAWVVGRLGMEPLAAITPATFLYLVPVGLGLGVLTAIITLCSRRMGQRRSSEISAVTWAGVIIALGLGALAVVLYPLAPHIFPYFATSERILWMEIDYFRVLLGSISPLLAAAALTNFFVGTGRSKAALIGAVLTVTANAFLSYGLVLGRWGLPELGLLGAAWGTVIAAWLQAIVMLFFYLRRSERQRFGTGSSATGFPQIREILRMGMPLGLQEAAEILCWGIVISWLIGQYGTMDLAAGTILIRLMQLSFLPSIGAGIAVTSLVGHSLGRGSFERARAYTRVAAVFVVGYMSLFGLLCYVFRWEILGVFTKDPEVIGIAVNLMILIGLMQTFDGMVSVYGDALRGAGDTYWTAWVKIGLCLILLVCGVVVVTYFRDHGSIWIWILDLVYVAILGTILYLRWQGGRWREVA